MVKHKAITDSKPGTTCHFKFCLFPSELVLLRGSHHDEPRNSTTCASKKGGFSRVSLCLTGRGSKDGRCRLVSV